MSERFLEVKNLSCSFEIERNFLRQNKNLQVLKDINFSLNKGVTLGIVGESGCGKSTLCRTILSLNKKDKGNVIWFDKDINDFTKNDFKTFRKRVQVIFQDPYGSLNPRMTIGNIISEP